MGTQHEGLRPQRYQDQLAITSREYSPPRKGFQSYNCTYSGEMVNKQINQSIKFICEYARIRKDIGGNVRIRGLLDSREYVEAPTRHDVLGPKMEFDAKNA